MSPMEDDIRSTPEIARQTIARVDKWRDTTPTPQRFELPAAFLGCGSSYYVGVAMAWLYEVERGQPAQGIMASQYLPRPGWLHMAISRTGKTSELVTAMRQACSVKAPVGLIIGDSGSPAESQADQVLPLEFASEEGVIQTRFITAAALALRLLIGGDRARQELADLPDRLQGGLQDFDPQPLTSFRHVVFLGSEWRYGLAQAATLNLQETTLLAPEGHQTLEYRHGPIASADEETLVWCFDPPDNPASAAVIEDVRRTGAQVRWTEDDPLVSLMQAQLLAVNLARARGVDPQAPRHLTRAIVLPGADQ